MVPPLVRNYGSKKSTRQNKSTTKRARTTPVVRRSKFSQGPPGLGTQFNIVNLGAGFPKRVLVKLRYTETITLSTTGDLANHLFRANSIFDPNFTGTGHQPYWHDEFSAVYGFYTVVGSRIRADFVQQTSSSSAVHCVVSLNEDSTVTANNVDTLTEVTESKRVILGSGSPDMHTINNSFSLKKRFGNPDLNGSEFRASVNANPTESTFYVVSAQSVDRVSTNAVDVIVTIEYIVVYSDIKEDGGS